MTDVLRIAHINPSFYPAHAYGGPTESGLQTAAHLARLGHDVRVLTTDANGASRLAVDTRSEQRFEHGLRVRYCRRAFPETVAPSLLRELPGLVAWADVIHLTAVYNFTTFPTLLARLLARKPLIWTPRGALLRWTGSRNAAAKAAWDAAARVLLVQPCAIHATSDREAEGSRARMPGIDVFVAANGVHIAEVVAHVPSDTLRLVALGRIDPIKGLEHLLDALAILRERSAIAFELAIVGDGAPDYIASLRARVAGHGLTDQVHFAGRVDPTNRAALFARTDVLVSASHSENFGMVIAEALAHGVPVIASTGTPWSKLLVERAGVWVGNSPASLADAIAVMAAADRIAMGVRGRAWMQREYSWSACAAKLTDRFERMLREADSPMVSC